VSIESLLIATRSPGKLRELRELFRGAGIGVLGLDDAGIAPTAAEENLESAETFEANALAKARYFADRARRPVVADDSGLEVLVLCGRPGVRSKRWSGRNDLSGQALDDANNAHLLDVMRGLTDREARYVCVAAFVDGHEELTFRGTTSGTILDHPRGSGGFGYDPYFLSEELGVTFGEATLEQKERVSHRGRAFHALVSALERRR
jgi:XTP/dITP diphosphohydrolase